MTPPISTISHGSENDVLSTAPLLFARGFDAQHARHRLSVLLVVPDGAVPPPVRTGGGTIAAREVDRFGGYAFFRHDLAMPMRGGSYTVGERSYSVALRGPGEDMRVAFVSCNGKEEGDFERPADEREALWARLAAEHDRAAFSLLLMGGDQIYADAALEAHPDLVRWADAPPRERGAIAGSPEAERAATDVFLDRWIRSLRSDPVARLAAEVPMFAMWDDHDIFDGYGSHPVEVQQSPIGQMVYRVARRIFRLFQAGGHEPADPGTLTAALPQPGFHAIAPDLRTERRPDRVMGPAGWAATEAALAAAPAGEPVFLVSTVPALGPRLSLVEAVHRLVPGAQRYEDDLRDQWQSRAHRGEWRRFLDLAARRSDTAGPVTFLSGEIHLAGRAEMRTPRGSVLHQLIASGVSHPPPPGAFARALGALGTLGEAPLADHPISILPLPGGLPRYVAERNTLILERVGGAWRASWDLELSGRTPWLALHAAPGAGLADPRGAAAKVAVP